MTFASEMIRCPAAYDADLGNDAKAQFADLAPELQELLAGTAGCSPYLATLIGKHGDWLRTVFDGGADEAFKGVLQETKALDPAQRPVGLRNAKGKVALLTGLADLAGVWTLEQVTAALSDFADAAVDLAINATVGAEIQRGKLPDVGAPAGGVVALAMGKMGAGELNYSSDIDLIVLFDGELYGEDFQEARASLVRATRRMAGMLNDITDAGYVFRTDLRLRPDASVTPVCLSMAAAESYYESVGRTWERAAYIKARAAAGDIAGGEEFLKRMLPFVWRKHLDFAAIQDAHDMRLRIRAHKGLHGEITLPGHNMKLGRGGIREIEFFTQTRQLIAGGRDPDLRDRRTVNSLAALAQKDWVGSDVADALTKAYRAHREVEHRLQMIADAQTQQLPNDDAGFDRLAAFMGVCAKDLKQDLKARLEEVHSLTESFFAPGEVQSGPTVPQEAQDIVDGWYSYPALRSTRAVEIFERLKPEIMARLSRAAKPQEALEQFDLFLSHLPAGVQVFSLFDANLQLVDLIIDIASTAPALAEYLGRNAQVFDAVIGGSFFDPWPGVNVLVDDLAGQLGNRLDYEGQLDAARRWHKEWHFRIGVHYLRGLITARDAGRQYAELAEATLKALWSPVVAEFARKHGDMPGRGAVVVGMGSLGSAQLSATSDLDVIVIYDAAGADYSEGKRPLAARQYYARLTQAFVTALSAQTAEGALYEVDMRLRPSGRQGPVATSLESFRNYQQAEAWTWEHLALTRARAVAGAGDVAADLEGFRQDLIAQPKDRAKIAGDVAEMRTRLADAGDAPSTAEAKRGPGRAQDIELLGQMAALLSGAAERETPAQLGKAEPDMLRADEAAQLIDSYDWFSTLQAANRFLTGKTPEWSDLGEGAQAFIRAQLNVETGSDLANQVERRAAEADCIITKTLERAAQAR